MARRSLGGLTRDADAPMRFEGFFIAAVASFLGIRWFLAATGYPRIGSAGIHVAHMLWGGLLMLLALLLLLAFIDRSVGHVAAVIAGLGFGTFIDEIGKFVTSDNDYFYRPSVALVYAVFVLAFLVARSLVGQRRMTPGEALANALDLMAGAPASGIEPDDRARIEELLALADPADPRTGLAAGYLAAIPGITDRDGRIEIVRERLAAGYVRVMAMRRADDVLIAGVVAYAALAIVGVILVVVLPPAAGAADAVAGATIAQLGSTVLGAGLIGWGVLTLRRSRVDAFHWFMRGLLVWILVTQVFVFYSSQLGGLAGLAVDLVAYGSLRYAIGREDAATRAEQGVRSAHA